MIPAKERDLRLLFAMFLVSAALLSLLYFHEQSPTGHAVFDGNIDSLRAQVAEMVRTFPLTAMAGDGAEVCLIINDGQNAYTFDLYKSNGNVEVTSMPYSRYCDNTYNNEGSEDIVIQYADYDSFASHAASPTCDILKLGGDGKDFYYLPSEFVALGGVPVCNSIFQEKYCAAVRACATASEMRMKGFDCCLLPSDRERQLPILLTNKYFQFFIFLFFVGLSVILTVYVVEERKARQDKGEFDACVTELKNYVDYCSGLGQDTEKTRAVLLQQGWKKEMIEHVMGGW